MTILQHVSPRFEGERTVASLDLTPNTALCVTAFARKGAPYLRLVLLRHNGDEYQFDRGPRNDREIVLPADHEQLAEILALIAAAGERARSVPHD